MIRKNRYLFVRRDVKTFIFWWSGSFEGEECDKDLFVINAYNANGKLIVELFSNEQEMLGGDSHIWVKR